jgi:HEAT repeat protein
MVCLYFSLVVSMASYVNYDGNLMITEKRESHQLPGRRLFSRLAFYCIIGICGDAGAIDALNKGGTPIVAVDDKAGLTIGPNSPIADLISGLESENINQWSRATTFLGMRTNEARLAVPALVKAIGRPRVRYSALYALKELGPSAEEAIPMLLRAITDFPDEPSCRWVASQALANIGSAAVPALNRAAASRDPMLKVWTCAALVKSEGSNSLSLRYLADTIVMQDWIASEALQAIKMIGPLAAPILPQLMEAMNHSRIPRKEFVEAFARIGKDAESAMPEVLEALGTTDALAKIEAIRAVKAINGPSARKAVPLLIKILDQSHLITAFQDPFTVSQQPRIREEAAEALGKIGPEASAAVPALIGTLGDPEERVRANAISTIKRIDPTNAQAQPWLISAMSDPSFRVQNAANAALLKAGPVNREVIRAFIEAVRRNANHFAANEWYSGPSDNIVPVANSFFYRLGPEHRYAVPDLAEMARDPHPGVQRIAFTGLTRIGEVPKEFVPTLLKQLEHYWAWNALKKMGPDATAAVPSLVTLLNEKRQRHAAADILASIGRPAADPAIPVFERLISEMQFPEIHVCEALRKLDPVSKVALDGFQKIAAVGEEGQPKAFEILEANARLVQGRRDPEIHLRYLSEQVNNADQRICAYAVNLVLECKAQDPTRKAALDRLFTLFETAKDEWAIEVAARGLAFLGPNDKSYTARLIRMISVLPRTERFRACASAIEGLGNIGPEAREALPELKRLLNYKALRNPSFEDHDSSLESGTIIVRKAAGDAIRKIEQPQSKTAD